MSSNDKPERSFLKKKIQIGGSSSGLINYTASQTVFHHDDISAEKRKRKEDVRAYAKQDTLVRKESPWDKSTHPNNPLVERRAMENFVKDRCTNDAADLFMSVDSLCCAQHALTRTISEPR